MANEVKDPTPP